MKGLFSSFVFLAAVSCAIAQPTEMDEKTKQCMMDSKMTIQDAMGMGQADYVPTPAVYCFFGCMGKNQTFGGEGEVYEEGSKDAEAQKCVEAIKTTDPCKWGQEMADCAKQAGILSEFFGAGP